jgi:hypothetical protein
MASNFCCAAVIVVSIATTSPSQPCSVGAGPETAAGGRVDGVDQAPLPGDEERLAAQSHVAAGPAEHPVAEVVRAVLRVPVVVGGDRRHERAGLLDCQPFQAVVG